MAQKSNHSFKIGFYIRVNSNLQNENPNELARTQEDRLRQAVECKNRTANFGEIKGIFADVGFSARNTRRPQFQKLLAAIKTGEIDLIMVDDLSRLTRNLANSIELQDLLDAHGCRLISISEPFSEERMFANGSEK